MIDEPVFSARAARDEDTRADALAFANAGDIAILDEDACAPDPRAAFAWLLEATFNEYERRYSHAPDTLKPLDGYPVQTPGTYGAAVAPSFLRVMWEIMNVRVLTCVRDIQAG